MTKKKKEKKNKEEEVDQVEELKEEIKKIEAEKEEYLSGWKRAKADFINYKKKEKERSKKEKWRIKKKIVLDMLEVLDSFYLAEKNIDKSQVDENFLSGFRNIKKQLIDTLSSYGLEEVPSVGEIFDPNLHEAVVMVEDEEAEEEEVIEEVRRGYFLDGELLRPARVKVSK